MRLYSPVELTGNVNMTEKLVLGGTGTGDLPILSPSSHASIGLGYIISQFSTEPQNKMLEFQSKNII